MAILTVILLFKRSQFRKEPHSKIREQRILSILGVLHSQRTAFGTPNGAVERALGRTPVHEAILGPGKLLTWDLNAHIVLFP